MITYILPSERKKHSERLNAYFRLRKRVFCDKLRWVQATGEDIERDQFDDLDNVYILYSDPATGKVAGGVRLMPTMGPTLLHSVWADLVPPGTNLKSPCTWEATRFCVDEEASSRKANLLNRATLCLSMSVADFGHANGIRQVVAVCEDYFFTMAGAYGPKPEVISSKVDENGLKISCGIWQTEAIQSLLSWSRALTGNCEPALLERQAA